MPRKITDNFEKELKEAWRTGELVTVPYTKMDGTHYDITIKVDDFFETKGRKYVWALKDGKPNEYRSLRLESIG